MRVVIVEDEALLADRLARFTRELLAGQLTNLTVRATLASAAAHLHESPCDLLLLDLNLNGQDGFHLLQQAVAGSFHTSVVSANTHRAIEAFELGVLDFVPKPFSAERLRKAFDRLDQAAQTRHPLRYLAVRHRQGLKLLDVADVAYISGAGIYSEIHLRDGSVALHDKSLQRLLDVLPPSFTRLHKSYVVPIPDIRQFRSPADNRYEAVLTDGTVLPVGRERYRELKQAFG